MYKLLFLLGIVFCGGAGAAKAPRSCADLVSREYVATQTIIDRLTALNPDPLVASLELKHLTAMRASATTNPITWGAFYPFWIFNSQSTLEEVLEYFDPHDEDAAIYPHGIVHWVEEWEKFYAQNLGDLARRWTRGGKRRFTQRLLVECAVRYAIRIGMGNEPRIFMTSAQNDHPSYRLITSGIDIAFKGNSDAFQQMFDDVYRRRTHSRLGEGRLNVPAAEATVRGQLREVGVNLKRIRDWKPQVSADYRARRAEADIELGVESIIAFGESKLSLAGLLREGTHGEGEGSTRFDWDALTTVARRHGGPIPFLNLVNEKLAERGQSLLTPQLGTSTLTQELVIQAGCMVVLENGDFQGFQASDPNEPFYLDMDNEIIQRSGYRLIQITDLVKRRLEL